MARRARPSALFAAMSRSLDKGKRPVPAPGRAVSPSAAVPIPTMLDEAMRTPMAANEARHDAVAPSSSKQTPAAARRSHDASRQSVHFARRSHDASRASQSASRQSFTSSPRPSYESIDSSWDEGRYDPALLPLPPPAAHHPTMLAAGRPKLLSQLTRTTLPTASMTYATPRRSVSSPQLDDDALQDRHSEDGSDFPDLDPTTGLPLGTRRDSIDSTGSGPSLHLQQSISQLLTRRGSSSSTATLPATSASRPRLASRDTARPRVRQLSSTAAPQDWTSWATSWWAGNKRDADRLLSEADKAPTVGEEKAKIRRKYKTPKHPLVFCHGLLGFDYIGPASLPPLQISHWRGIREVLESNGVEVLIARVPATASIKDRATTLEELISEKFPGRQVNLVGHSMGGLDCRYLVSQLNTRFTPATLTTVSTPHRGSPFADYVIDNVIGRDRLPQLLSVMEAMRLPNSGDGSAFKALGTRAMKEFNAQVIDNEDVKYYSWGASFEPGLFDTFRWPHSVILSKEGPNDGLVSVHSAMWGEYRGTLVGVNHLDLVGWVNHVRFALSSWTGNPITFKPATFYLEIADYLAEQGF